jgi:pyridoxal 5'-phosphate synthase pdxT subunit
VSFVAKPVNIAVLALQGGVREHVHALKAAGVNAFPAKNLEQIMRAQGLVIPGGESTTMIKLAQMYNLVEPIQELRTQGMPMYGSCAGMIMLADRIEGGIVGQETIGGIDVLVRRNAFGRQTESFEAPLRLQNLGVDSVPFPGVFIRAPFVVEVGENVEVVGAIESGEHAGRVVAVQSGNLMATSFHPELTPDIRVHEIFVDIVRKAQ